MDKYNCIDLKEAYKKVLNNYDARFRVVEGYETDTCYYFLFIPTDADYIDDAVFDCVKKENGEVFELEARFVYCAELQQKSAKKIDLRKVVKIKRGE